MSQFNICVFVFIENDIEMVNKLLAEEDKVDQDEGMSTLYNFQLCKVIGQYSKLGSLNWWSQAD